MLLETDENPSRTNPARTNPKPYAKECLIGVISIEMIIRLTYVWLLHRMAYANIRSFENSAYTRMELRGYTTPAYILSRILRYPGRFANYRALKKFVEDYRSHSYLSSVDFLRQFLVVGMGY